LRSLTPPWLASHHRRYSSRSAGAIMAQNIVFSIGLLVILVPLAVLGLIGVALAFVAHEVAELLAVANGLGAGRVSGFAS
jgi:cation-transporting ATPase G